MQIDNRELENLTDKNPKDNDGDTPLHLASKQGHFEVCKLILKHVSDTNPKDEGGETPLHYAADFGHLRLFKFIMEHAIHKNPPNDYGDTPLHLTAFGDPQLLGGSIGSTEEKLQIWDILNLFLKKEKFTVICFSTSL